ncbi:MAG: valine--tRNA ligase, partial [Candidatus Omnitrophica bacterium]|nr:valine--tRNA ligase [Candidatus Omnitrophota bacterium]
KPFVTAMPLPNITGSLHMGHALNNTIQDVLIRFRRMQGFQALWMPGTDHAGIATQNVVEKDLVKKGLKKEDVGREKFIKLLWDWTAKYGSTIIDQLKKIGASCDWKRTRFTLDENYSDAVNEVFIRLYNKGLIYQGNYIINWCPRCKTALSDEESPYKEIDGWLYYIRYPIEKSQTRTQDYIVVATTRPETMLGDTAVAINPDDKRFKWLKGEKVILPIMNRELKVVTDEVVDPEFGTGIVKVTPAHDPADFLLGKKHNLEFINIMDDTAILNQNAGEFAGMDRFEARQALLEVLEEKKLIEKKEPYQINAGHCYRCHTIIEPRLSRQWFVKMKPLAETAIKVVEENKVEFYPERWKKVYLNWMYNIRDWCISRQIWWGHQLPVYYCENCRGEKESQLEIPAEPSDEDRKRIIVSRQKPDQCPVCGSKQIIREKDVLDTWFSSWLWPFATFGWPFTKSDQARELHEKELAYFYPTNTLVTASEILFFWVARMIMAGLEFTGEIPFKKVIIHGTVRDEKGVKMSKSLGNTIDPLDIIDKFGADSLRFSLMLLASAGSDIYLSEEKFLVGRNFCNKIWNAARFLLTRINEKEINIKDLNLDSLDTPDKWILEKLNSTIAEATRFLEDSRINEATKRTYDFFWHTFCDWYIEMVKDNFDSKTVKVLISTFVSILKLLHPVMPFISEEIFQLIKSHTGLAMEKSIMIASWPEKKDFSFDQEEILPVDKVIEVIKEIRNLKLALGIPASQRIKALLKANDKYKDFFSKHKVWITRLAGLKDLEFEDSLNRVLFKTDNIEVNFSLESIDEEKFIITLEKKITDLETQINRLSGKLKNQGFLKNAPSEVVTRHKDIFNELSTKTTRLTRLKQAFKD